MRLCAKLGYTAALLTMVVALLVPFVLYRAFARGVAALGLHVDEVYSGGPTMRTIQHGAYTIAVHREVKPHLLQREKPFVQMDWKPVSALPPKVADKVDLDGDGRPDLRVCFEVPKDPKATLHVDVDALNPRFEEMRNAEKERFSRLIVRVDDEILVRVPMVED